MTRRDFLKAMAFATAAVLTGVNLLHAQQPDHLPNILFILADDLGYGDISCYNPESKVQTPILDKLADLPPCRFLQSRLYSLPRRPTGA